MEGTLIRLLVFGVVVWLAFYLTDQMPPTFPKPIVKVVIAALGLIWLVVKIVPAL